MLLKRWSIKVVPILMVSALTGLVIVASAEDKGAGDRGPDKKAPVESGSYDDDEPAQDAVEDEAFERYIDVKMLGNATQRMDAGLLTDGIFQLLEGERILHRRHRSGVQARDLVPVAIKLAVETRDPKSLERLAKGLAAAGVKDFEGQIAVVKKIAASPRSATGKITVGADDLDATSAEVFKDLVFQMRQATVRGSKKALQDLHDAVDNYGDLIDAQKQFVKKEIKAALALTPEKEDAGAEMLAKITGASRAGAGTVAISTSDQGSSNVTVDRSSGSLRPVARCNLRNSLRNNVTFNCHGTGKSYTLKPGQSMNFTIYGRVRSSGTPRPAMANVIAVSDERASIRIIPPYLTFYSYAAGYHDVAVTNGNFNIVQQRGGYRLNRR